jgi:hypothetical protein
MAEHGFDPRTFGVGAQRASRSAAPPAGCSEGADRRASDVSKRVASASPSEAQQPKADNRKGFPGRRPAPVLPKPYAG